MTILPTQKQMPLGICLVMIVLASAPGRLTAENEKIDFPRQVAPILSARCLGCHNPSQPKGGLDLSTRQKALKGGESGPAFEPGNADESELLFRITPDNATAKADMPRQGEALTKTEISVIKNWINQGSSWPETLVLKEKSKADAATWWSLQQLSNAKVPDLPPGFPDAWQHNTIDRWVASSLSKAGLKPNPPADKRTLARRIYYDLTGLPPTPEQLNAFLNDKRHDAWPRLVDKLLASPAYGERWGRYWLDVVRFGESNGFERNVLIDNAWPFRDYVIRSLNQDKPFAQMIREHFAGDVIAPDQPADMTGVAFLTVGPFDDVGNQDPVQAAQIRANTIDDMIVATSSAFLGLTVGCARCHDHKFDPVTQSDYYKLQATFAGAVQGAKPLATARQIELRNQRTKPLEEKRKQIGNELALIEKNFQERITRTLKENTFKATKPAVSPHGVEELFPNKPVKYVRLTILNSDQNAENSAGTRIDELELWSRETTPRNVALASAGSKIEAPARQPGDFGDAYAPELMIDGRYEAAWVAPTQKPVVIITLKEPLNLEKMKFSSDRNKAIAGKSRYNTFVGDYILEISEDRQTWFIVADSSRERPAPSPAHEQARHRRIGYDTKETGILNRLKTELAEIDKQIAQIPNYPTAWIGHFSQPPKPAFIQLGGDPQRKGPEVSPVAPSYFNRISQGYELPVDAPEADRRKALANWIASSENPLTWRVLANRIWYMHFGQGLVDTPADFGYMGARPTHPELLDFLARELIGNNGRWKSLHRTILLSQVWQQSSQTRPDGLASDGQARLLWRYPPRRLDGEQIRDSMLFVSGSLDKTKGGPGFRLYQYLQDNVATYVSLDDPGPETWRRSVYHQSPRAARVDYLSDFDCPDNALSAPSRLTTTTPLQSMTQWNHKFTMRMASNLAGQVSDETNPTQSLRKMYQLVFQREPTADETTEDLEFAKQAGWQNLARVLLNSNEFLYLE